MIEVHAERFMVAIFLIGALAIGLIFTWGHFISKVGRLTNELERAKVLQASCTLLGRRMISVTITAIAIVDDLITIEFNGANCIKYTSVARLQNIKHHLGSATDTLVANIYSGAINGTLAELLADEYQWVVPMGTDKNTVTLTGSVYINDLEIVRLLTQFSIHKLALDEVSSEAVADNGNGTSDSSNGFMLRPSTA